MVKGLSRVFLCLLVKFLFLLKAFQSSGFRVNDALLSKKSLSLKALRNSSLIQGELFPLILCSQNGAFLSAALVTILLNKSKASLISVVESNPDQYAFLRSWIDEKLLKFLKFLNLIIFGSYFGFLYLVLQ